MTTDQGLQFLQSWTLAEFKQLQGASLQVMNKPKGLWFRCGSAAGQVSSKLTVQDLPTAELLVSKVEKQDGDEPFLLLHAQGGTVVLTL